MADRFDPPPRSGRRNIPRMNPQEDRNGNVLIPKQEWEQFIAFLDSLALVTKSEWDSQQKWLDQLTQHLADNYD